MFLKIGLASLNCLEKLMRWCRVDRTSVTVARFRSDSSSQSCENSCWTSTAAVFYTANRVLSNCKSTTCARTSFCSAATTFSLSSRIASSSCRRAWNANNVYTK